MPGLEPEWENGPSEADMLAYYHDENEPAVQPRRARHELHSSSPRLFPSAERKKQLLHQSHNNTPANHLRRLASNKEATFSAPVLNASASTAPIATLGSTPPGAARQHSVSMQDIRVAFEDQVRINDELLAQMESMEAELELTRSELQNMKHSREERDQLLRQLEEERHKHQEALTSLVREHAAALRDEKRRAAEHIASLEAERRELEASVRLKDVELTTKDVALAVATSKIKTLHAALDQEKGHADELAAQYKAALQNILKDAPSTRLPAAVEQPPTPQKQRVPPLPTVYAGADDATRSSEQPQTSRVSPAKEQSQWGSAHPAPDAPARQPIRDKNAESRPDPVTDPNEVTHLEQQLLEVCSERDSVNEELRKIENIRTRRIADIARKETLSRRLVELNDAAGAVRKRLRQLCALDR